MHVKNITAPKMIGLPAINIRGKLRKQELPAKVPKEVARKRDTVADEKSGKFILLGFHTV